jgi:hypothetical protein
MPTKRPCRLFGQLLGRQVADRQRRAYQAERRPADGVGEGLMFPPSRIVGLTEETVETLYLLGEQDRIVGISGYVVLPPQARREKPRVSAFTSANIDKILALTPDLVLTFSDVQADIAADSFAGLDCPRVQSVDRRGDSRDDPDGSAGWWRSVTGSSARRNSQSPSSGSRCAL